MESLNCIMHNGSLKRQNTTKSLNHQESTAGSHHSMASTLVNVLAQNVQKYDNAAVLINDRVSKDEQSEKTAEGEADDSGSDDSTLTGDEKHEETNVLTSSRK